jgi:AI-2 transport protein TqsA
MSNKAELKTTGNVSSRFYVLIGAFFFAALATVILTTLQNVFQPFLLAMLLFYIVAPIFTFLRGKKIPLVICLAIVIFGAFTVFYLAGLTVVSQIDVFNMRLPEYELRITELVEKSMTGVGLSPEMLMDIWSRYSETAGEKGLQSLGSVARKMAGGAFVILGNLMMTLFFLVFILLDFENFRARMEKGFGQERSVEMVEVLDRVNRGIQTYLNLKTLISFGTGVLVYVTLRIFGVDFAILWAALTFILNFIPTFGSIVASIPPVLVALVSFVNPIWAGALALVLVGIQTVIGNVIEPKLVSKELDLSPVVILLSLVYWGWVWGIFGMFIAVPATSALRIVLEQFDLTRGLAVMMSDYRTPSVIKKKAAA